ncbi:amidohydrolase ytcj [Trichoderma arundinaceum]|uniref:Amidohydrolase ytcj n=1 Tax=Trichoderma arundinaceum TaxID=490622 RepID=A0A395NKR9_TRIAR|nr:amidohydrolase ytcj [Trichoderma arundinaceum]
MAALSRLSWGFIISAIVAVVAALSFDVQRGPWYTFPNHHSSWPIYCYKSVRTLDGEQPVAECFRVLNGKFTFVWKRDPKEEVDKEHTVYSDGYVIPGLWDGHGHLLQYGEFLHSVDLFGSQSLDDVRDRIKAYLAANPEAGTSGQWLRGVGWDQSVFGRMPTADDIEQDDQLKGIYMMLDRIDVHCTWVSKAVLDLLPDDIPDVPGGEVVRDPGLGVFCDNAIDMVMDLWPKPGAEEKTRAIKSAMKELNKVGLVGMHDAGVTKEDAQLYSKLSATPDWTVRVHGMLECSKRNTYCADSRPNYPMYGDNGMFVLTAVKLFADGALGSWGSAMLEPYSDRPWTSGSLLINASALAEVTTMWALAGYQVNIHAIGDLANRNAIDAFEAAMKQVCEGEKKKELAKCRAGRRFRLEHAQIIHPEDQKRMRALGIIPSIQPTHATSDMKYAEDRLGPQRIKKEAYRMKSLLDLKPVLGSDFPVEPPNPFHGIYAAVTRKNPNTGLGPDPENPSKGWHTEEALSLDEALLGFTRNVAHGVYPTFEGQAGVIKRGAYADWVVLDEPLEGMDIEKLRTLKVRETWIGGRRVYSRDEKLWPLSIAILHTEEEAMEMINMVSLTSDQLGFEEGWP